MQLRITRDILFVERSETNNSSRVNRGEIKALYYRLIRNFIFIFTLLILKRVLTIYYHEIK